jgi:glycosyltransferase involved in cell wall biosynthesis
MEYWRSASGVTHMSPDGRGHTGKQASAAGGAPTGARPLVSIVIPCYNGARYLAETIESALLQTYSAIEVIVVDDGSSDATARIAQAYPVTYVRQENRGVSAARNNGIHHSHGKYLVFLDHDDRLLPEAVTIGVRLLEEHPECSTAVGEHGYIGSDGDPLGSSAKRAAGRDHYLMLLEHNFIETPGSAVHRRSSFAVAGVFDESVQGAEDHELYLRMARHTAFIAHDAKVSEYRLHETNSSRNAENMLTVSHRVMQMELPYVKDDEAKLQSHHRGLRFVARHFGRQLTRQLIHDRHLSKPENRQKLKLLKSHYVVGFAAAVLSRCLPMSLLNLLLAVQPRAHAN